MTRGYLNGYYYSLPVENYRVPGELLSRIKQYDPALDVKYLPRTRDYGLFRLMPARELTALGMVVRGNRIDPEYVLCGTLGYVNETVLRDIKKFDPKGYKRKEDFRSTYNKIVDDEEKKEKKEMSEDLKYCTKHNSGIIKRKILPTLEFLKERVYSLKMKPIEQLKMWLHAYNKNK